MGARFVLVLVMVLSMAFSEDSSFLKAHDEAPTQSSKADNKAQDSKTLATHHRLFLIYENDSNFNSMVDKYYTAGVRLAYYSKDFYDDTGVGKFLRYVGVLPYFSKQIRLYSFGVFISQEMYAPKDKFSTIPPSTDHPYGGYLYASFLSQNKSKNLLEQIELDLGIVGPAAKAKQVQDFIHKITNNALLAGWDTQLENEFVANLSYRISYRYVPKFLSKHQDYIDFMPQANLSLGNAKTFLQASIIARAGYGLIPFVLPTNINTGFVSTPSYAHTFSLYAFVGAGGRIVGRNMFLQGNLFAPRTELELIRGVGEFIWGVALDYKYFHLAYNVVHRSKEFRTQDGFMTYGVISLGASF